jgi:hypothetical protein
MFYNNNKTQPMKKQIIFLITAAGIAVSNYSHAQEEFKPSGNLWGFGFGDWANKSHNDTLLRGGGSVQYRGTTPLASNNTIANNSQAVNTQTNAFQFRRIYLGYDYKFAPNFSAQIVLANEQNYDASGKNTTYVKFANVKCSNIFKIKNTDFVFGQYLTASWAMPFGTEPLGGYRVAERMIMDMHALDNATDLGASLQGKAWTQHAPDSIKPIFIGYALQVGNNNGAVPNANNFKKVRATLFTAALQQKLTVGLYGDYLVQQLSPYKTSNTTLKVYAAYTADWLRIGAEVFRQTNKNSDIFITYVNGVYPSGAVNDTASGVQMGWSVFASGRILKNKLNIFARMDMYSPNTKFNNNNVYSKVYSPIQNSGIARTLNPTTTFYTQTFYSVGIDWTPHSRFHIIPNIWYNGYKTMMTTSGAGGTGADLAARIKSDYDLVYRITFYFIFNSLKKVMNNGFYE